MARSYILIGGNLGDRERIQEAALCSLERDAGRVLRRSSLFRSAPWGFDHDRDFLNRVVQIETECSPFELLKVLLHIEEGFGRRDRAEEGYQGRYLDLDILYYDDRIVDDPSLQIPHPRIPERRFTLVPLSELAPDLRDPQEGLTVGELLKRCPDPLEVKVHDPTCVTNT